MGNISRRTSRKIRLNIVINTTDNILNTSQRDCILNGSAPSVCNDLINKAYRDCIKDSTPSACNGLMNKNNTFFCDCPDEITQQVCAESNDLPCVKAGLASSTCLTIDGIVSLCNDSAFLDHFNDQEKINNNPRLSFYNTIQYHSGLNANK